MHQPDSLLCHSCPQRDTAGPSHGHGNSIVHVNKLEKREISYVCLVEGCFLWYVLIDLPPRSDLKGCGGWPKGAHRGIRVRVSFCSSDIAIVIVIHDFSAIAIPVPRKRSFHGSLKRVTPENLEDTVFVLHRLDVKVLNRGHQIRIYVEPVS